MLLHLAQSWCNEEMKIVEIMWRYLKRLTTTVGNAFASAFASLPSFRYFTSPFIFILLPPVFLPDNCSSLIFCWPLASGIAFYSLVKNKMNIVISVLCSRALDWWKHGNLKFSPSIHEEEGKFDIIACHAISSAIKITFSLSSARIHDLKFMMVNWINQKRAIVNLSIFMVQGDWENRFTFYISGKRCWHEKTRHCLIHVAG